MTEIDTSSYPKPQAQPSGLAIAGQIKSLQQQDLGISQAKLDQANQSLNYMTRAMGSLGPDATKEDYLKVGQNVVDMGLVPKEMLGTYAQRLQAAPTAKDFFNEFMTAAASHQQQIDYHLGRAGESSNGQTVTPTVTSVKPGFGQRPTGLPVQQQAPPISTAVDENGQQRALGAQPPQLAPGTVAQPTPLPAARPAMPNASSGPTGPTVRRTDLEPTTFADRFPQPRGASAGAPPLQEEGKRQLTEDQANAAQKMTAVKPAILAMKLMDGLRSGPSTEPYNKAVALLKANNIIDTKADSDPTVVYQEVNKYLHQYLKARGGRSDADLTAAENSSPNVGTQLNPALQSLTRSAIAQDRIEAARPNVFTKSGRTDYQNYGEHRASFPQSMDERAFSLDTMPKEESQKLVRKMVAKYKANPKNVEANRFLNSLHTAEKEGHFSADDE